MRLMHSSLGICNEEPVLLCSILVSIGVDQALLKLMWKSTEGSEGTEREPLKPLRIQIKMMIFFKIFPAA